MCFFRVQQDLKPLPQKKCPLWSITSSRPSSTPLRFPRVSMTACDNVCTDLKILLKLDLSAFRNQAQLSDVIVCGDQSPGAAHEDTGGVCRASFTWRTPGWVCFVLLLVCSDFTHNSHIPSDTWQETRTSASIIHVITYDPNNQIWQEHFRTLVHMHMFQVLWKNIVFIFLPFYWVHLRKPANTSLGHISPHIQIKINIWIKQNGAYF